MSDFYDNQNNFTPNIPPVPTNEPIPPNQYTSDFSQYTSNMQSTPEQPAPQPEYQQQYYRAPEQNQYMPPRPEQSAYYNPNYAYIPKSPKQPMSGGLKAFIIIVVSILGASLIGFIAYISMNSQKGTFTPDYSPNNGFEFTMPTQSPYASEPQSSDKEYPQSDAQKETDPKFSGVKLNEKPKTKDNYGSGYAFNNVEKSVVGVICYTDEQDGTANSYTSMGSGIIVTSNGYIVTNSHIINNSRTAYLIKIVTADKKEYDAGVVGYDSRYDLAVLKVNAQNLPAASFGNSDDIEVTEDVIAVGNPRSINYQNSVTKGIISALNRQVSSTNNAKFIQTDAAINTGNSGGPLCNMYGQVIGITTSKIALEEYEGMGFAIPVNTVKKVADSIIKYSYVKNRVKVGIVGTVVTADNSDETGIQIEQITPGGPMDNTGAQVGDILTKVDGKKISTFAEVYDILESHKTGDKIKITLYRPSTRKSYDITITLQEDKT
ncbi:MAG: trypsin-like peptidase domain-containing protein [Ruminococcus sp.]|nr:trypsin-like peptidase domain-containing protein [Ruminococcus sp.]